jgi:tetratricopeptide (TPR) repeat protein
MYYNQKNYEQAVGYYRSFEHDYSTDTRVAQAMFQEGQALSKMEHYSDAVDIWNKLGDKFPDDPLTEKAHFQAARTLFDLGNTTAAVKAYQTFIVKHPNSTHMKEARLQLAHAYYNAGDYKDAIPKYQEFLALYPNAEEAASVQDFLQIAYVQTGKTDQELEQLTQGQAKSQVLADLYWEKGAKAFNAKDYPTALGYFEKILIEFPASSLAAQAAYYRAESLYLQEKYPEASAAYKNFLGQYPNDQQGPTALFHLGVSLFNQNLFEEAAITFENFVQRYPNDPLAKNAAENIPLAYARLGRTTDSEQAYENLLNRETDPAKKAGLLLQMGQMKEKGGQMAEAIKFYDQVPQSAAEYQEAQYSIASLYSKAGQTDNEMKVYDKMLNAGPKENPFRISGISRLAEIYISQGKAKQALGIYQEVVKNATDQNALANAKTRVEELQKVLQQ